MIEKCIPCPDCKELVLVSWIFGDQHICCDKCWQKRYAQNTDGAQGCEPPPGRVVYAPVRSEDGIWITKGDTEFRELRRFIEECIAPETVPESPRWLLVSSPECVNALLDLLEAKMDDPLQDPEYLAAMRELQALHDYLLRLDQKQQELKRLRAESCENSPTKAKMVEKINHKLWNVEQRMKDAHKRIPEIEERAEATIRENRSYKIQERVVGGLRSKVLSVRYSKPSTRSQAESWQELPSAGSGTEQLAVQNPVLQVKHVPWTLLEPEPGPWERLQRHYAELGRVRGESYDFERLRFFYDFQPSEIYVGRAAFEGYVVFCFPKTGRAFLECPKVGNAIYVMDIKDWKALSRESKTKLLLLHRGAFSRIIHIDNWRHEISLLIECGGVPLFEFFKMEKTPD